MKINSPERARGKMKEVILLLAEEYGLDAILNTLRIRRLDWERDRWRMKKRAVLQLVRDYDVHLMYIYGRRTSPFNTEKTAV